jgi:hypothetical protein
MSSTYSTFSGLSLENGAAYDDLEDAALHTNVSTGAIADTLIGPMLLGASFNVRGGWRYYVGVGRLF